MNDDQKTFLQFAGWTSIWFASATVAFLFSSWAGAAFLGATVIVIGIGGAVLTYIDLGKK